MNKPLSPAVVAAFLGVLTAGTSAWIAWQQHLATRNKLRLDLFDKRYAVFTAVIKLLSRIAEHAKVEIADLHAYNQDTNQAVFLFENDMVKYIDDIRDKALTYRLRRSQLENIHLVPEGQRSELIEDETRQLNWFTEQFVECRGRFQPYLGFHERL